MSVSGSYVLSSHLVGPEQQEKDPLTLQPKPVQAAEHVVNLFLLDVSLQLSLALGPRFAWETRIPFRMVNVDASFLDGAGREMEGFTSIHHRDEVVAGISDVELGARVRLMTPSQGALIDVSGGLAFPTGHVEEDPFRLGREGREHQHIFFGSGTLDPYLGLNASRDFGPVTLAFWSTARAALYRGSIGYQAGNRLSAGLSAGGSLGLDDWYFTVGPELYHEEPATWGDGDQAVNSGRTDLTALAGAYWQASETIRPYLVLKKPFTVRAQGGQFELPVVITAGADFNFGATASGRDSGASDHAHGDEHADGEGHEHCGDHGDEDDHGDEHDHSDEHDHGAQGGDVTDVASGGESFAVDDVVEPKRITVIDFWATWCRPCKHVDSALRKLAAEHPEIAVRRAEVIDDDSPVVREHLGGEARLPAVWIYDRDGKRVHTLAGTNEKKLRAVLESMLE